MTADDLGASVHVNRGVLAAHERGIVTGASVLVTGPAVAKGVAAARAIDGLTLGLHLAFVQGRPISPAATLPSLVRADGTFLPSAVRLMARRPRLDELEREATAQMETYLALCGGVPSFVNTHQHTQLIPAVLRAMIRVCNRYGVSRVRLPAEAQPVRLSAGRRAWLWPAASLLAVASRGRLRAAGLTHPDRMLGGPESGRLTPQRLRRLLRRLPCGTVELVVHPSQGTEELAALTDPALAKDLDNAGVVRISFDAL